LKELPVALCEINDIMIFSGSAAVDKTIQQGFAKDGKGAPRCYLYSSPGKSKQARAGL
jgi:hypothetical protein